MPLHIPKNIPIQLHSAGVSLSQADLFLDPNYDLETGCSFFQLVKKDDNYCDLMNFVHKVIVLLCLNMKVIGRFCNLQEMILYYDVEQCYHAIIT